jgi:protocatechuate 3,4-dioxygenase, alpha subunit
LLQRVVTRIYFPDEEAANAADPVLAALPATAASETLIAAVSDDGYRFDVHLQGEHETVFFSI